MNSKINTLWRTGLILGIGLAAGMLPAADKNSSTQVRLVTATIDTRPEAAAFRQSGLAADKITHDLRAIADSEGAPALIPVLIQFEGPLKTEWRRALTEQNIRIIAYIPDNAVLAQAPAGRLDAGAALECVRWMGHLRPEYKIAPGILRPGAAAHPVPLGPDANSPISTDEFRPAYDAGDFITITIRTLSPDAVDAVTAALTRPGGVVLKSARGPRQGTIRASVRPADLAALAAHPQVEWIERYRTPQIQNNVAAGASFMNADIVRTNHGLTGLGQVIGVCDTGLDTGDLNALHPDFTNRVRAAFGLARPGEWSDLMGHGTHVCGSVLGSGSAWSNGLFKGIAPGAELVIQSAGDESSHVFLPADLNDLFIQAYTNAARLHSDSWGDSAAGEYSVYCQQCDEFVWDHPDFLALFSAGNSGTDTDGDGVVDFGSIGAPAAAKNVMAVGAAISDRPAGSGGLSSNKWGENWYTRFPMAPIRDALVSTPYDGIHQGLAAFSSRGPCRDGRIKPDIVAPGTDIISCRSRMPGASELWGTGAGVLANGASNFYAFCGGTSMSTPLVAGAAVLARQYLVENRGIASPGAALIKALMAAGARTLSSV